MTGAMPDVAYTVKVFTLVEIVGQGELSDPVAASYTRMVAVTLYSPGGREPIFPVA